MTGLDSRSAAGEVRHRSGRVETSDGLSLVWQAWAPPAAIGVVVVVHGLAEHSGRYGETGEYLAERGWAVYAMDLRGHGLSPDGRKPGRVHVDEFSDYSRDVGAMVTLARQDHPDLPLFLLGHSMGGLISLSYALAKPGDLAGAVISSPALGTHPEFQPPRVLKWLVGVLSRVAPRLLFKSDLDAEALSRDPDVVRAYLDDPLVSEKVSARWYASIIRAMKRAHEQAPSLAVPVLLMQSGADRLVDPGAPLRWAARAPDGLVTTVTWQGFYHEMLHEPEKDRVRHKIIDWLAARSAPKAPPSEAGERSG